MTNQWTPSKEKALAKCLAEGMEIKQIALRFGTYPGRVAEKAKEMGLRE